MIKTPPSQRSGAPSASESITGTAGAGCRPTARLARYEFDLEEGQSQIEGAARGCSPTP